MIKLLVQLCITLVAAGLFFIFTDPGNLPVGLLMIPIILIFVVGYLLTRLVLRFATKALLSDRKQRTYAILTGLVAGLIMLFQSTGGIIWADVILMSLIVAIAYFYVDKL